MPSSHMDFNDRVSVRKLGSNYTRRIAVPNGAKPLPLIITGIEAAELIQTARVALRDTSSWQPVEVGVDRSDCKHGCKIMAQRCMNGDIKFYVQHYSGYGCDLGHNSQRMTRDVIVERHLGTAWTAVFPKADYIGLECME